MFDLNSHLVWLTQYLSQLPELAACLGAGSWVLTQRRRLASGVFWAVSGFGILMLLALLGAELQTALQQRLVASYTPAAQVGFAFMAFRLVWSILRAAAYACLTVAILANRPATVLPSLPTHSNPPLV